MSNVVHSHKPYGNDSVVCVWLGIKENKHNNKVDNTVFLSRAKYKPKLVYLSFFLFLSSSIRECHGGWLKRSVYDDDSLFYAMHPPHSS